ncbi:hypothetical protein FRC12_002583 [Ceratobasidium sp. 428]|nr:hypothetical protein FRC12_002583 [Ceratobasidium sp. 428]
MAPRPTPTNKEWLDSIMRGMFSQTQNAPAESSQGATEETETSCAARDARRLARVALQMAIGILDAADEKQDEANRLLQDRLGQMERTLEKTKEKLQSTREELLRQKERVEMEKYRRRTERHQQEEKEQARILEEKEKEAQRQQEEVARRTAEQATTEALRRAQAEAKKYREAVERAQKDATRLRERAERAEEAQRLNAARADVERKSKDQQAASAAWSRYTGQWELFRRFALAVGPVGGGGLLRFEDIPWPMLSCPSTPGVITKDEIAAFIYSSSQGVSIKARIRECLLTWHPDKFSGRWMRFVLENDRTRVIEGVTAVTRAGNEIMTEYANRRNTL